MQFLHTTEPLLTEITPQPIQQGFLLHVQIAFMGIMIVLFLQTPTHCGA